MQKQSTTRADSRVSKFALHLFVAFAAMEFMEGWNAGTHPE
jgi:hypothetical protein